MVRGADSLASLWALSRRQLGMIRGLAAVSLLTAFVGGSAAAQEPAAQPAAAPVITSTTIGANLNISPKRVTFDRAGRTATVFIFNQGSAPAMVDIGMVDRIMLPDGQITPVDEALTKPELKALVERQKSAKDMIMITPRRATLPPGKGQTIRIRVAPDASGANSVGEFRSHLTVTTIPPRDVGLTAEDAASANPEQLRFVVNSVFGLSIPLIVRLGPPDIRASIENAKVEYDNISPDGVAPARRTPVLTFDLVRVGANSLFGNIEVRSGKTRAGDPLGVARGVGVYTEIERRAMRLPITRAPNPGEPLEITFTDDDTSPGTVVAKGSVAP